MNDTGRLIKEIEELDTIYGGMDSLTVDGIIGEDGRWTINYFFKDSSIPRNVVVVNRDINEALSTLKYILLKNYMKTAPSIKEKRLAIKEKRLETLKWLKHYVKNDMCDIPCETCENFVNEIAKELLDDYL